MSESFFGIQFVPVPFCLLDSEYLRDKVGAECLMLYLLLRRYVWREVNNTKLGNSYQRGFLVASMSRKKLAEKIGRDDITVWRWLKKLRELGWVKVMREDGDTNIYYLGTHKVIEKDGIEVPEETFFADMVIAKELAKEREKERKEQKAPAQ